MTVGEALEKWAKLNGKSDPRPMLDSYFYSHIFVNDTWGGRSYAEHEAWCNDSLGPENWHREFAKFWFTSQSDLTMFKMVWFEADKRKGLLP